MANEKKALITLGKQIKAARKAKGLPLVKALIELHGGTVELQSQPGKGTTVTLHF